MRDLTMPWTREDLEFKNNGRREKMENESKVVLSLEDYTKLILENNDLKNILRRCEGKARQKVYEETIRDSEIGYLTKEKCEEWLSKENKKYGSYMLGQFAYSWQMKSIAEDYPMFQISELEGWALERIKELIGKRLDELKEEERKE